ncbi:MAG: type III pantothenate kinase [Candidatus Omnitrophota bacterium]
MIITIDIGNTTTGLAVFEGEKIVKIDSVKTGTRGCYEKRLIGALRGLSRDAGCGMPDAGTVVCSVVPKALTIAKRCVKKVCGQKPLVVGKDILVPMDNHYRDPSQVGQDRLVCAYAAAQLYGYPAVVVDLGTAITFDVVGARKGGGPGRPEYLGGIIAPGIRLSAETLFQQTALLPQITIHKPRQLIGQTTEESILSGMFYGYGEMIKGIVDLLSNQLRREPKIIVTGGYSEVMVRYISGHACLCDSDLVFKGLASLLQDQHKKSI